MKKKTKILIYVITFIVVFLISALIRIMLLGSAPERLIKVEWDESVGEIYSNLDYENDNGNQYDLYIPSGLDKSENQYLILFIHGGSFNSGSKEDGESWCKYYATKGYITASVDYTLQNQGKDASIYLMNEEIENAVTAIKQKTEELGYHIAGMAPCGVSAGGTLAMNLAYNGNSAIPVKFVFQLAAPTYFAPSEWSLLMKVDRLDSEEEFCKMMTGKELEDYDTEIQNISLNTLTVLPSGSDSTINVDLSQTPSYFKGGTAPGSYVTITYTGQFQGNSLDGVTVTAVTGDDPDSLGSRELTSTVSGTIIGHTANTVTLQTGDGATITCFTEGAKNISTSNMESGAGICITFDPTKSKNSNIYTSIKIQDA